MKNSQPLSWKAERKGSVYCAPACGFDCKLSEFEEATAKATRLAKRLGKNFSPRVWENMGWHWSVTCGNVAIYPRNHGDGTTFSATYDNQVWTKNHKTAKKALIELEKLLQEEVAEKQSHLDEIRSIYW